MGVSKQYSSCRFRSQLMMCIYESASQLVFQYHLFINIAPETVIYEAIRKKLVFFTIIQVRAIEQPLSRTMLAGVLRDMPGRIIGKHL